MPWPHHLENILGRIHVPIGYVPTMRTEMGTDAERFLHYLATLGTLLRGEARVHSDDLMTSSCSLLFKDVEELAPRGVQDGFRHMMVLDHSGDSKVFYCNMLIVLGVLLRHLEMMVTALSVDLQMGLGYGLGSLTLAVAAFLATAHDALLASECLLRGAVEARVLDSSALAIGEERLQPDIKADVRMLARRGDMLSMRFRLAHNQGVPMSIGAVNKMYGLGRPLNRAMQLDLEEMPDFLGYNQVFLVFMQIAVFPILPQLDGVPAIRLLEAREANSRDSMLFGSQETFERLGEPISKHLHGGGRHMIALPFESRFKLILARKYFILLVLCFDGFKHAIIDGARLYQASQKQASLFLIRIQSKLKRSHTYFLLNIVRIVKREMCALRRRHFIPRAEARALMPFTGREHNINVGEQEGPAHCHAERSEASWPGE